MLNGTPAVHENGMKRFVEALTAASEKRERFGRWVTVESADIATPFGGCYAIVGDSSVYYVGQSKDIRDRLRLHGLTISPAGVNTKKWGLIAGAKLKTRASREGDCSHSRGDSQSPLVKSSAYGGKGCPILVRTRGQISADLLRGENSTGQRFASIPAFTATGDGITSDSGMTRRQCTKEYKVEVIDRTIRYELLGLSPGDRLPKGVIVHQYIGISWEERSRAFDIARRFETADTEDAVQDNLFGDEPTVISVTTGRRQKVNWRVHFPLIEDGRRLTRDDCAKSLRLHVPHTVYGSACIECPYQDNATWARRMAPGPTRDALITIDTGMRTPGVIVNRNMEQKLYLHRSCLPIDQIDFTNERQAGFAMECEGGCGL